MTILNEFPGVREFFGLSVHIASFPISSFWRPQQWSLATLCLFVFPETPEKQHSPMSVLKGSVTYFITTGQTQVKEFKPPIKTSFSSTTFCRQRRACSDPRAELSPSQQTQARGRAGWDGCTRWPDSTWCQRSVGILHQKLQDLVKEKTCAAYSCKRKVQICGLPFESVLHLQCHQLHQEVLNIQQFWKSWHLPSASTNANKAKP